jgi:hypothetical protein
VQTSLGDIDVVSMPSSLPPPTAKPLATRSQDLGLPLLDFVGEKAELIPLLPGLSNLYSGGNVCRFGGLHRLVRQVSRIEITVIDSICMRNVDLRAKLIPIKLE